MSRVIPIALATNLASGAVTLAWAIRITRLDDQVFRFTSHDRDVEIDGDTYASAPVFDVESLVHSAGLAVDNTEITVLADDSLITRADLAAGRWDGAAFTIFQYNWAAPADGEVVHMTGTLGNMRPRGLAYVAELRDLRQALQQDTTAVLQPTCRYRLGDAKCTVVVADFTETFTVTAVGSQSQFTASGPAEAADFFTEGEGAWLTGANAGLSFKVRSFAGGVFGLAAPMVYAIQVGDTGEVVKGCQHTRQACKGFSNILNFGGEPDKSTIDELAAPAEYG